MCFQICYSKAVLLVNLDVGSSQEYLPLCCAESDFGFQGSECIHVLWTGDTVLDHVSFLKPPLYENLSLNVPHPLPFKHFLEFDLSDLKF